MNDKEERFVRIAENRTNKIINMIRLLGNCANKNNYQYTNNQVDRIFRAIEKELDITKKKYAINQSNERFSLK